MQMIVVGDAFPAAAHGKIRDGKAGAVRCQPGTDSRCEVWRDYPPLWGSRDQQHRGVMGLNCLLERQRNGAWIGVRLAGGTPDPNNQDPCGPCLSNDLGCSDVPAIHKTGDRRAPLRVGYAPSFGYQTKITTVVCGQHPHCPGESTVGRAHVLTLAVDFIIPTNCLWGHGVEVSRTRTGGVS